jgi:hypothetical protein
MRKLIQGLIALCLLSATFAFGQTSHVVNIPDSTPTAIRPFNVHIVVRRADGTIVSDNWGHNLRTTGGADWQANVETGTPQPAPIAYFALSSNSVPAAAGDCPAGSTACVLSGEITTLGLERAVDTYSHTNGTNTFQGTHTWTATGTQSNIQEAGWFNAPSGGTMALEISFAPVNVEANFTISCTWFVTF